MTIAPTGGEVRDEDALTWPIPDLDERLEPGGVVPAGECPSCGALAYVV
ncbi:hypothetical protein H7J07_05460 [Mycobacterium koreense]|nr:hypothetical protein [Mycolicibacillus koreensis]MCV7247671.1 hypothetical protein [Mycolicibacillus koreensis]